MNESLEKDKIMQQAYDDAMHIVDQILRGNGSIQGKLEKLKESRYLYKLDRIDPSMAYYKKAFDETMNEVIRNYEQLVNLNDNYIKEPESKHQSTDEGPKIEHMDVLSSPTEQYKPTPPMIPEEPKIQREDWYFYDNNPFSFEKESEAVKSLSFGPESLRIKSTMDQPQVNVNRRFEQLKDYFMADAIKGKKDLEDVTVVATFYNYLKFIYNDCNQFFGIMDDYQQYADAWHHLIYTNLVETQKKLGLPLDQINEKVNKDIDEIKIDMGLQQENSRRR